MMRRVLVSLLSLVLVGAAGATVGVQPPVSGPAPTNDMSSPIFVLSGGGYGHGVGLNQYGALAQAKANRGYRDILAFYYPGTEVTKAPVSKIRVLVAEGRPGVRLASTVPYSVRDGSGAVTRLAPGEITVKPDLRVDVAGKRIRLPGPLAFLPGKGARLVADGKEYRGQIQVAVVTKALQVIDVLKLDDYLLGVVPGEVPKEWPAEALRAQAVAARSYAIASAVKSKPYDVYSDTRSQVYYGVAAEAPSTTAAVRATAGEILSYAGKVATTFYYSSSGGRTASSEDVFGVALPYLQARDDPWDTLSPYHRWAPRSFTAATLGQAFRLSGPVADVVVTPTDSGRPTSVTLIKKTGVSVLLRAADVRAQLGLRSTAFRFGVLRVARPAPSTAPGAPVVISGVARDVSEPLLQKLSAKGTWLRSARLKPKPDGVFATTVRPRLTTTYRLVADGVVGPALTASVATEAAG